MAGTVDTGGNWEAMSIFAVETGSDVEEVPHGGQKSGQEASLLVQAEAEGTM